MSHKIPTTLISSETSSSFEIFTDSGSITVSGAFFLLGDGVVCTTFATGSTIFVTGTAANNALVIQADSGQASPLGGILNFVTPLSATNLVSVAGLGNSLALNAALVVPQMGGTGNTSLTQNSLLYGQGLSGVGLIMAGSNGQVLLGATNGVPFFETITSIGGTLTFTMGQNSLNIDINLSAITLFNPLPPSNGGLGQTLLTAHGVLIGEGSFGVSSTNAGTNGQVLLGATGGDPEFATITSQGNTLTFTFGVNSLNVDVNVNNLLLHPIPPPGGGTGQTTFTAHGVLLGEGGSSIHATTAGTNGQVLIAATGADPQFANLTSSGGTLSFILGPHSLDIEVNLAGITFNLTTLPIDLGGTGQTVLTVHGVLIGEGSLGVHVTAAGTDGQAFLGSTNKDPAFSTITSTGNTLTFTFGHNSLNIDINFNSTLFHPISPGSGSTGQTLFTAHGVLIGEGSLGVVAIAAGTDGQLLLASTLGNPAFATITSTGGTLTFRFGHHSLNMDINFASSFFHPFPPGTGSTGRTVLTAHGVIIGEGSLPVDVTAAGTNGQILLASATGDPLFSRITSTGGTLTFQAGPNSLNIDVNVGLITFFNILQVSNGGTGLTVLTSHGILIGEGSSSIHVTPAGTNGQLFLGATGADPQFATVTSTGNTLTFTFGPNSLNIDIVQTHPLLILATTGTATPAGGFLNLLGSTPITTIASGSTLNIQLDTSGTFFNPVQVKNGGTGVSILTTYGVLIGEGSNSVHVTLPGTDGQLLLGTTGADPQFATITSIGQTLSFTVGPNTLDININPSQMTYPTPLPIFDGGLGRTVLTLYGVLLGEGSLPVHVTAAGTNGQVLIAATNADPKFATITSSGRTLTFIAGPNTLNIEISLSITLPAVFPVSQGGTGRTVLTTYGVLIGEGSGLVNVTAPGTDGQALIAATGLDPKFATISSTGGTFSFSFGPNSLNMEISLSGATGFGPIPVSNGGTGVSVLTAYGVLLGEGSKSVHVTPAGTSGQALLAATGLDPLFATISSTGGTLAFLAGPNALNIDASFSGSFFNGFPPANGGTGRSLLTAYGVLIGEGSRSINVSAAGTNGQIFLGLTNADPAFATISSTGRTMMFTPGPNALAIDVNILNGGFVFPVSKGGTGQTTLTAYGVLIGEGSLTLHTTAAGTDGQILISSSTGDPAFATISSTGNTIAFTAGNNSLNLETNLSNYFSPLQVSQGGTGDTSFSPAYAVICGGATSTSAWQPVASAGSAGQVLTSNGPGVLPSFQNPTIVTSFTQVSVQNFLTSGIYNPSPNMRYVTFECIGGGGGGGGATANAALFGVGGGGGGGGYCKGTFPYTAITGPQIINIGAGGLGGTNQGTPGSSGNNTSIGVLMTAQGGSGGQSASIVYPRNANNAGVTTGGAGGVGFPGSFVNLIATGQPGSAGIGSIDTNEYNMSISGAGGSSYFQAGASSVGALSGSSTPGNNGVASGAGGGGAASTTDGTIAATGAAGGNGAAGTVIITEYLI